MKSSSYVTHYEILQVESHASHEEIRKAYLRLARIKHPDKNAEMNANQAFQNIQSAYEVLSDRGRRKIYDAELLTNQRTLPTPNPFNSVTEVSEPQKTLHPDELPESLVASIQLDSLEFLTHFLSKYPAQQLAAVLVRACSMGKHRIPAAIIDKYPDLLEMDISLFYKEEIEGPCSLMFPAVCSGSLELVTYLISKHMNINESVKRYKGHSNATPLLIAVSLNLTQICSALALYSDVKTIYANHPGITPESILLPVFQKGNAAIASTLLQRGVVPENYTALLSLAIEKRHYDLVALLCNYINCESIVADLYNNYKNCKYAGELMIAAMIIISHFGMEKTKELHGDGAVVPLSRINNENEPDFTYNNLFKAIGSSCDMRIIRLLNEKFPMMHTMIGNPEFQKMILLGALEKNDESMDSIPNSNRFGFCKAFLRQFPLRRSLKQMPEVKGAAEKLGPRFLSLLKG